jgi:hypothetical protein
VSSGSTQAIQSSKYSPALKKNKFIINLGTIDWLRLSKNNPDETTIPPLGARELKRQPTPARASLVSAQVPSLQMFISGTGGAFHLS